MYIILDSQEDNTKMFAFTKPLTLTKSQKKNKQKASRRNREKEYWDEWSRAWYERRNSLELTFRIWSGKEFYTLEMREKSKPNWRPSNRWSLVAQGGRMPIPDVVQQANIWRLKKVLHCLSMKDISWDFYNDLIIESHKRYANDILVAKNKLAREKQYEMYLDWYPVSNREKKSRKKQK